MKENNNRQVVLFFVITFAFSWLLWLPQVLKFTLMPELPDIVGLPGMFAPFGPAVAAFWLTFRQEGKAGARSLWQRAWQLNFKKVWLLPAVLLGPITALLTVGFLLLVNGAFSWEYGVPAAMIVPIFLMIYFVNALPEEFGWRGYVLDPLQKRSNALVASLVLGFVWSLWHLPLFFIEGTTQSAIPMVEFFLQTMVLSILYTWLHNNTGGSILIAALFHAVSNASAAAVPFWTIELGRWIDFGILVICVAVILAVWGSKRLSKAQPG